VARGELGVAIADQELEIIYASNTRLLDAIGLYPTVVSTGGLVGAGMLSDGERSGLRRQGPGPREVGAAFRRWFKIACGSARVVGVVAGCWRARPARCRGCR
jgi:hypothetical protein